MTDLPKESEMNEVMFSKKMPTNLTYPDTFKLYFKTVKDKKRILELFYLFSYTFLGIFFGTEQFYSHIFKLFFAPYLKTALNFKYKNG